MACIPLSLAAEDHRNRRVQCTCSVTWPSAILSARPYAGSEPVRAPIAPPLKRDPSPRAGLPTASMTARSGKAAPRASSARRIPASDRRARCRFATPVNVEIRVARVRGRRIGPCLWMGLKRF
jgi:hypothetical protein